MTKNHSHNIFLILAVLIVSFFCKNTLLTLFSLVTLIVSLRLVWRKNEPPIFPFIIIYHWFQISTKIIHANVLNKEVSSLALSNSTEQAIWFSLIGLLCIALGIKSIIRKIRPINFNDLLVIGNMYSLKRLFKIYLIFFVIFVILKGIMFVVPSLTQLIAGVLKFKIILVYLFFLVSFIQKKYKLLLFVLFAEILFGLSGFFSSFKEPFFLLFLAYFTVHKKVSIRTLKFAFPVFVIMIIFLMTWTAIKVDYRRAINKDSQTMVVNVSLNEQIQILTNNLSKINSEIMLNTFEIIASRLSYVDYFGQVIDYIPNNKPHEYGKLWFNATTHIFTPRFLFPNKPILDDSKRTMEYTGNRVSSLEEGTSISIGYFAESFIDFGSAMFSILLLLGIFYGIIYKMILSNIKNKLLGYSIIIAIFLTGYTFEIRNDKLIGGVLSNIIIIYLMWHLMIKKYLGIKKIRIKYFN